MCGIVGIIPNNGFTGFSGNQQKMFKQLLLVDLLRGGDATGVIGVYKDGDFSIQKEATDGYCFNWSFDDGEVDKRLFKDGIAAIGHNRAKTIGENKDENAHPFVEEDSFAMVHNGTLRDHKSMEDTEVDSHALTITFKKAMDEEDWKTAMEKALGQINGAFAVAWYDQKRHQVCLIRNSERPLWIAKTKHETLFGSEVGALQWIANRNGSNVDSVEQCKIYCLYTFDMKKQGGDVSETFLHPLRAQSKATKGTTLTVISTTTEHLGTNEGLGSDNYAFGKDVSKQQYKALDRRLKNQWLTFWVDDYVDDELNAPTGKPVERALVMGSVVSSTDQNFLNLYTHTIRCKVSLPAMGLKEEDLYGIIKFQGQVYDTVYDKDTKSIIILVTNVSLNEEKAIH